MRLVVPARLATLAAPLLLGACFAWEARDWGEWTEPGLVAGAPAASFRWDDWPGMVVAIDGHGEVAHGYKRARVAQGHHAIEYRGQVHDFGDVQGTIELDLGAGSAYDFRFDTCYWCSPRRYAVWVEGGGGAVVWGTARDWPRWWL